MTTAKSARRKGLYFYPKKIAKLLGPWWYGDDSATNALIPTRNSGALLKIDKNTLQIGDLCPSLEWVENHKGCRPWILSVELKHTKSWSWKQFFQSFKDSKLQEFWDQCYNDAVAGRLIPILIFTKNYDKDYVMFYWNFPYMKAKFKKHFVKCFLKNGPVGIGLLSKFLEVADPDMICVSHRKHYSLVE